MGEGGSAAEVTRQAWMSASCLSMASSLELSLGLEGEPCAGMPARMDVAKSRRACRVSVGTLRVTVSNKTVRM